MCEAVKTQKSVKERRKSRKTSRILRGMATNITLKIFIYARYYFDLLVDFISSIYWDGQKELVPLLDKRTNVLTNSAINLAKKIRDKQLSSEELVTICIERIKLVNPIINAVTDERFDAALAEAKEVDKKIAEGLTDEEWAKKPFLGVPFTTKETHSCKGMLYTLATWSRRRIRATEDAENVRLLKEAGAILVATSNVPECNLWQETRNMIYGQTNNPYHTGHTVGGSSGGEAALVASLASPFGLASDIGGSIRMPAYFCGLFGYCPTPNIINMKGCLLRSGNEKDSMAVGGFVTKHAEDLIPLTSVIAGEKAPQLKLDRVVQINKLKFYFVEYTSDVRCSYMTNDVRSVMRRVISKITNEVTSTECAPARLQHEGFNYMFRLWRYMMTKEPRKFTELIDSITGGTSGVMELAKKMVGLSNFTLAAIIKLIDDQVLPKEDSVWAEELLSSLRQELMTKLGDDGVLLFPSYTRAAPFHYTAFVRPYDFGHWCIFNALKFPSTQVPLGLNSAGLPLGVQVVATPNNDALTIEVAKFLEKSFGGYVPSCGYLE